jgi:hypothetical protein
VGERERNTETMGDPQIKRKIKIDTERHKEIPRDQQRHCQSRWRGVLVGVCVKWEMNKKNIPQFS